jgi:hypothetical protein
MSVGVMKDYKLKLRDLRASHTLVGRGTGTPKDKDEVNKREVCECEGWVRDLDAIGAPSRLTSSMRNSAASTPEKWEEKEKKKILWRLGGDKVHRDISSTYPQQNPWFERDRRV